jgi:glucose-1-phosphate adenylyltransferase
MTPAPGILSRTATLLLAGGRGARLAPLTHQRSKPAVPFGDQRIIDFALANCLRSNLNHPAIITQYQASHLTQHVRRWWLQQSALGADASASPVSVPAPEPDYLGTADALFRNVHRISRQAEYVLVLSADHIYEMDYRELLQFHVDRGADVTLASLVYPSESSKQFGILDVDSTDRILEFEEKPAHPRELPGLPGRVLANMGVYVFQKDVLLEALKRDADDNRSSHDIGRDVLPSLVKRRNLAAFRFENPETRRPRYWKDVGTIDSYFEASMHWLEGLPGTHRLAGSGSVIAEGVRIHRTAEVTDSILMPGVQVGPGARICRTILDENVRVLTGARLGYESIESQAFTRTPNGIVVVPANSTVPAASEIHADPRLRQRNKTTLGCLLEDRAEIVARA